ncbi:MAG: hypothetical protein JKX99_11185 [Robiginitomaculum sp.]|nr:hypothetical protein [Robiginitomaculum sp.]
MCERETALHGAKRDLESVDRVLVLLGYRDDPKRIGAIRTPKRIFANKELSRLIIQMRRDKPELADNPAIAREIIVRKGWDTKDRALYNQIRNKVKDVTKRRAFWAGNGTVE